MNRVAIHCFQFVEENLRRQPWRYVRELAKFLQGRGVEVTVYSAMNQAEHHAEPDGIPTLYLPKRHFYSEFHRKITVQPPRALIDVQGIHSFLNNARMAMLSELDIPLIGVITSPLYTPKEVFQVGPWEWLRNHRYLFRLLAGAILPHHSLASRMIAINDHTVVLSEHTRQRLIAAGIPAKRVHTVMPGKPATELPELIPGKSERLQWELLYLGSPLSLRGSDVALRTLSTLHHSNKSFHLTMLCRTEHPHLKTEVKRLKKMAKRLGVEQEVTFIPGVLPGEQVKASIRKADFILQPFKIVISDMPIAILESMALGKITVSTRVDGIPGLLTSDRGIVVEPNDHRAMAGRILEFVNNPEKMNRATHNALSYIRDSHPTWGTAFKKFLSLMNLPESITEEVS